MSLVVLGCGFARAEEGGAPLVLDGGVLVERWARPAPGPSAHYGVSGWYDLLVAHGTRLDVVDLATGETRASFDVGCEVRGLTMELVLCDDEVRWIADLRYGLFVPLEGAPPGVRDADVCGDKAVLRTDDAAYLVQLPSKMNLDRVNGRVAPFELPLAFPPARAAFDDPVGCTAVVVEGNHGERAFFERHSGAPRAEAPRFLDEIRAYTLLDRGGSSPAAVGGALVEGAFVSEPRWQEGGALLRVRDAVRAERVRELLVVSDRFSLAGTLLYVVDDEGVRAYSSSLLAPSDYEPQVGGLVGFLDVQALALFGGAVVGLVAGPALLWALQPDLGGAAIGVGLLATLGAVPLSLGVAALGTAGWLLTLAATPAPRAHTGSGCLDAGVDAVAGPAHACASAIAGAAAIPLLVVGTGLVVAAPFLLATMTVADPAGSSGTLDPLLLTTVTTSAVAVASTVSLGLSWLVPLPDDEEPRVAVVLGRLVFATSVGSVAGATAYGVARALTR